MNKRTLTITLQPDWRAALRAAGRSARAATYQGEVLNFESPGQVFSRLSENRWDIVRALQGHGELAVRELARRVGRDVKRVHEDVQGLAELGLLERSESGGVLCPFAEVHICSVPCDHLPIRSWPLFRARELMRKLIEHFQREHAL